MTIHKVHRNFIFVKPIDQSESKLILPPVFRQLMETVKRGVVHFAGPQAHVSPGETIVFNKWQDSDIMVNGEKLLILQPNAVIAVEA